MTSSTTATRSSRPATARRTAKSSGQIVDLTDAAMQRSAPQKSAPQKSAPQKSGSTKTVSAKTAASAKTASAARTAAKRSPKTAATNGRTRRRKPTQQPITESEQWDGAVDAVAGATPAAFLDERLTAAAAGRMARKAASRPWAIARQELSLGLELARIGAGTSAIQVGDDKRFADDTYRSNPLYRRLGQSYLAWSQSVRNTIDELGLDAKSKLRAEFVAALLTEAVAPTNSLAGNPAALKEAWRTKGASLVAGARHALHDVRKNGAMPSMVDTRPFTLGENIAATPGAVVLRTDLIEVIRYAPTTPEVHARPLVVVPPQINKYYVLDLAPGRSVAEGLVGQGHQVFMISWRNPGPDQRDWDMDRYCRAILDAVEVARELTDQPDVNLLGVCAGGITSAALLAKLAADGDERINAVTFLVTVLDWDIPSTVGTFTSGPAVAASISRSQRDGVLKGRDLARLFAWLRPNDLVWNYWVNNYLMGKNPPAFDILTWNDDATNLPAGLHADFLTIAARNGMAKAGEVEVLGDMIDVGAITCDAYVVAGLTDHITPWQGCYNTVNLLGGDTEFVACASGHIQTLVCPTDNPKAKYLHAEEFSHGEQPVDPEAWKASATEHGGSWWPHWFAWLAPRAGELVAAPTELGDDTHPIIEAAPGSYVRG